MPGEQSMPALQKRISELESERVRLLQSIRERDGEIFDLRQRVGMHVEKSHGNYWAWQGDGEDHVESLVCPILISANQMQEILTERDTLRQEIEKLRGGAA